VTVDHVSRVCGALDFADLGLPLARSPRPPPHTMGRLPSLTGVGEGRPKSQLAIFIAVSP
jgi:hypothetical protein